MINCSVYGVAHLLAGLLKESIFLSVHLNDTEDYNEFVDSEYVQKMETMLKLAEGAAEEFEWESVKNRIGNFRKNITKPIRYSNLDFEVRALYDLIADELKGQLIYRYPTEKAKKLLSWKSDWKLVIEQFPDCESDVVSAVDLWSLSHNTASVFHSMRVIEIGIGSLASEVGKKFETQNWQNIIEEIESAIKYEATTTKKSKAKSDRLQFLSECALELYFFKDCWRNHVSHNKSAYNSEQALNVLDHGRRFMNKLSEAAALKNNFLK